MDPIKEAMIRDDDGLSVKANTPLFEVHCRRCGDNVTDIDHDFIIGPRAGHYCFGCTPDGEVAKVVHANR